MSQGGDEGIDGSALKGGGGGGVGLLKGEIPLDGEILGDEGIAGY